VIFYLISGNSESHRPKGRCFCEISPTIFFWFS